MKHNRFSGSGNAQSIAEMGCPTGEVRSDLVFIGNYRVNGDFDIRECCTKQHMCTFKCIRSHQIRPIWSHTMRDGIWSQEPMNQFRLLLIPHFLNPFPYYCLIPYMHLRCPPLVIDSISLASSAAT
jgi:hypothetical protein